MASQITHILYGKKVLDLFLRDKVVDEKSFFIGTLFPDIRYLGVIDREKTHDFTPTVEGLRNINNSFELGMYTHSFVDFEREKTLERLGAYNVMEKTKLSSYAMKFIEDEITYDLILDWNKYQAYLDEILEEETRLVSKESVEKWHKLLQRYFQRPTWDNVIAFAKELEGFTPEILNAIRVEETKIKANPKAMEIIRNTYSSLFFSRP